jgi:predicted PurR-regulated permease PerM
MTQKRSPSLGDKLTEGAPRVLLVLSLLIVYRLRSILALVALAILVSLILQTLLSGLEKIWQRRWLAILALAIEIVGLTILN